MSVPEVSCVIDSAPPAHSTAMMRSRAVCVLVNENKSAVHAFYCRAGFKSAGIYETIFLRQKIC